VWVKAKQSESYLSREEYSAHESELPQKVVFFSKNPALAQREFADVVMHSTSPTKFRMTSENVMNPNNEPDGFETRALQAINKNHLSEFTGVYEGAYRYAKPIYHTANCIKCHGDTANAPEDVLKRYGSQNGFGFKEGDLAGIISVSIPTQPLWADLGQYFGPIEISLIFSTLILSLLCVHFWISRPLKQLASAADDLSLGSGLFNQSSAPLAGSANEITALQKSLGRLGHVTQHALKKWRDAQQKNT
jgi:HAMP domain-containing protein